MRFWQISLIYLKYLGIIISVLIVAEFALRISDHKNLSELFIEDTANQNLLVLNKDFTKRYSATTTFLSVPSVKKNKEQNTLRIFCLGIPVPENMPYNPNVTYPHILNNLLQRSFPDKNIELINIPINEANSFMFSDICKQLPGYGADYVLINPGYEEFTSIRHNNLFTFNILTNRLSNSLVDLQLLHTVNKIFGKFPIQPRNTANNTRKKFFEENLNETVAYLHENNIKPILINNSNNLLDIPPQKSRFSSPDSVRLSSLFKKGEDAYLSNNNELAYSYFSQIYKKDKAHAATAFYLGKLALKNNEPEKAKKLLQKAADVDEIPERTTSDINALVTRTAIVQGCSIIDIDNSFSQHSPMGIPGDNLFLGYSEPNLTGNILIAVECYKALVNDSLIKGCNANTLIRKLSISTFDSLYNSMCNEMCIKGRKIQITPYLTSRITSTSYEKKIALLFAERKTSWEESMNSLYEYYIANKNYTMAFKIIDNLALENPHSTSINEKASQTASMLGDSQLVVYYGKKVFKTQPKIDIAKRLFISYLKLDMPEDALPYISYVCKEAINPDEFKLLYSNTQQIIELKKLLYKDPANSKLRKNIAMHYTNIGNNEVARLYSQL